jgi:ubiquitin-protein ligase
MILLLLRARCVRWVRRGSVAITRGADTFQDNIFEWHFTVRGPPDSEFEGGLYHGVIQLPTDYPMAPPNVLMLTVGRPAPLE